MVFASVEKTKLQTLLRSTTLAVQVVHHPTVLAAYCEGRRWTFEGDAEVKSKFWGRSIELTPLGLLKLTFADGDTYTWNKVPRYTPSSKSFIMDSRT